MISKRKLYKMIEDDIKKSEPTKRVAERNALKKYMNKRTEFTAILMEHSINYDSSMIGPVMVGNKIVADHTWLGKRCTNCDIGDEIIFDAEAGVYTDSNGVRKYKLKNIRNMRTEKMNMRKALKT